MLEPNCSLQITQANFQAKARIMMAEPDETGQSQLLASRQTYQNHNHQQQQQPEHESYLACYEDLSSIYRHHRKRPRSTTYSPFDSASPASSTATNTTADSLLGSSSIIFSSDLTISSNDGDGRRHSSLLSPPPLTFNLLSASPISLASIDSVGPNGTPATSGKSASSRATSLRSVSSVECNESSSSGADSTSCEEDNEDFDRDLIGPAALLASDVEDSDESEEDEEEFGECCHQAEEQGDEDEKIFHNLILKERRYAAHNLAYTMNRQRLMGNCTPILHGHLRRSLLSWMLHVCVQEQCQDEIFALATMILDKFLTLHPTLLRNISSSSSSSSNNNNSNRRHNQNQQVVVVASNANGNREQQSLSIGAYERELEQRQLIQFASCSLMLATKLRQTPRLCIRTLIQFSKFELPVALTHDDLTLGERFMLDLLKWDIAGLVTPNEFLHELLTRKCQRVMFNFIDQSNHNHHHNQHQKQEQKQQQQQQQMADTLNQDDNQLRPSGDERRHRTNSHHYLDRHNRHRRQNHLSKTTTTTNHHHGNHRNHSSAKCKVNRVNRHTQILLELCMLDDRLSQLSPSTLAMASMAVAIFGLSTTTDLDSYRLDDIVEQIHNSTDRVNKLDLMIEVAHKIEGFLQEEARKTTPFGNEQHD